MPQVSDGKSWPQGTIERRRPRRRAAAHCGAWIPTGTTCALHDLAESSNWRRSAETQMDQEAA
jgi:hypothetical protein